MPSMAISIFLTQLFIIALCQFNNVESATFTIKNNCGYQVWPGALTGTGGAILTGFELPPKATKTLTVNPPWSGKFWARTQCSGAPAGSFTCQTADCSNGRVECNGNGEKPPATLIEFTLAGANRKDFYDISLVDGFNIPVSVKPDGANCPTTSCAGNVNGACPNELAVKGGGGVVIACKSACVAFGQPQYCCSGNYGSPDSCKPTKYSMIFKQVCPQAYSYAFDDKTSTFTCPTGGNYLITFCP